MKCGGTDMGDEHAAVCEREMQRDHRGPLAGRRGLLLACGIVLALNLPGLVYVSDLPLEDDPDTPIILSNVREDMSARGLLLWFTTDWPLGNGLYRPLVAISLAADSALFGDWARGYRLMNWGMAVLTALGLLLWARELGAGAVGALLAAGFFSLQQSVRQPSLPPWVVMVAGAAILAFLLRSHLRGSSTTGTIVLSPWVGAAVALYLLVLHWIPLTSVVSWIAARTALMGALCTVWAMVAVTRYAREGRAGWLAAGFALTALALCSYEQALMVPSAMLLLPILTRGASRRRAFTAAALILLLLPTYGTVRLATVGPEASEYVLLARKSTLRGAASSLAAYVARPYRVVQGMTIRLSTALNPLDRVMWWSLIVIANFALAFWRLFAIVPKTAAVMLAMQAILFLPMAGLHIFQHYYYLPGLASAVIASALLYPWGVHALETGIRPAHHSIDEGSEPSENGAGDQS